MLFHYHLIVLFYVKDSDKCKSGDNVTDRSCGCMLWPYNIILLMDTTRSLSALRSYTRPEAATVHSDWRPQHLTWYIETIYSPRLPQYIVTRYIEAIYSQGCHGTLWLKATTFDRIHRGYLQPKTATVHCDWRPQYLTRYIEAIYSPRLPQFIVTEALNIW